MSTVITSQPLAEKPQENTIENADDIQSATPLTAPEEEVHKLKEARKAEDERAVEEVCCCVLESTSDFLCLCQCFAWCFRNMAYCLDQCFEGCADCISGSCENCSDSADADSCFCCSCDCSD